MTILVRSMGKIFPAKALHSDVDANSFCERHKDWAVIGVEKNGIVFVASKYPLVKFASDWLNGMLAQLDIIE